MQVASVHDEYGRLTLATAGLLSLFLLGAALAYWVTTVNQLAILAYDLHLLLCY